MTKFIQTFAQKANVKIYTSILGRLKRRDLSQRSNLDWHKMSQVNHQNLRD